MIKSEREYTNTKQKVIDYKKEMSSIRNYSKPIGDPRLAKAATMSQQSFYEQLEDEVKEYELIKKGNIPAYFFNIENLGILLIALRIKSGFTQAKLAKKLNVSQAQVCRDENNDYYGVGLPKVAQILKALSVDLQLKIKI